MGEFVGTYAGLRVLVDPYAFPPFKEDWSGVRSPSRAERRRKRGFKQRIRMVPNDGPRVVKYGNNLIVNEACWNELKRQSRPPKPGAPE